MTGQGLTLRPFHPDDLMIYFQQQRDPIASHMAAFTREVEVAEWVFELGGSG